MQTFKQNYPFKVRVFMDGHLCGEPVYKTAEEAMAAMSKWLRKGADYVECVDHV